MGQGIIIYALAFTAAVSAVENGLARTPQMGWVCRHARVDHSGFETA